MPARHELNGMLSRPDEKTLPRGTVSSKLRSDPSSETTRPGYDTQGAPFVLPIKWHAIPWSRHKAIHG
jgi:hypothetical protein